MELLKLLLDMSLIFITIKIATGKRSYLYLESEYRHMMLNMKLIRHDIDLVPCINEDDYKNDNIYKIFKSYIDEQRRKGNFIFYGESTMFFQGTYNSHFIHLDILNVKIDKNATKLIVGFGKMRKIYNPDVHVYYRENQGVNIYFTNFVLPDLQTFRIIVKFVGSITDNTGGFMKTSYINNKGEKKWLIVGADFWGTGAQQIFPCWFLPNIRTNFYITIKHHYNYTVLSNMPIDKESPVDTRGMLWTRFRLSEEILPYHLAIVLSDFDNVSNISIWCREPVKQQIKFAQRVAENATSYLKRVLYNAKLPSKVDHVVIPGFPDEGIESWGLILYKEISVIFDEKLDFVAWKFEVARIIARKMVHQFFGNQVGPSWWSYLWLNEGIATFLAMKMVNEFINPRLMDLLVVQFQHESLRLNEYYNMSLVQYIYDGTLSEINSLFSFTYYIRAPIFIRSLLQVISIDALEIGLNKYLNKYQFKSIDILNNTVDNFFNVLQEAVIELHESNITLANKLRRWTMQEYYPVIDVMRISKNEIIIKLSQQHESYPEDLWICVIYTIKKTFNVKEKGWLNLYKSNLHLTHIEENDWILVNVQQDGYYRVNYDNDNWQKLGKYLNSSEYLNIHVLNRAQIIDDAYYFLSTNKLNFSLFQTLTYYLSKETDYVAWYPVFKILEQISGFFPFSQSIKVKEHFGKLLDLVLSNIGFIDMKKEDEFTKCLRQEAAKWACTLNSQKCMTAALYDLMWFIYNPVQESILPGWKEWWMCKGMMSAENDTWNKVLKMKISNMEVLDNKLLESLGCSVNHTIIISYIDRLKSGYFTRAQDRVAVFHSIIARHAKNNLVLDYILQDLPIIVPREIHVIIALNDIINHLYSKEQFNKLIVRICRAKQFLRMCLDVNEKVQIRLFQIKKHMDYFESFLT